MGGCFPLQFDVYACTKEKGGTLKLSLAKVHTNMDSTGTGLLAMIAARAIQASSVQSDDTDQGRVTACEVMCLVIWAYSWSVAMCKAQNLHFNLFQRWILCRAGLSGDGCPGEENRT